MSAGDWPGSEWAETVYQKINPPTKKGKDMAIDDTLKERGKRYGDFSIHAAIAQELQVVIRDTEGWRRLSYDKKQALTVIADKIARILSGDPEYKDNWHDIQGYAKLAEDRCLDRG
jgi:hypothetical protein